jgi:hypothetical protein
MKLSKKYTSARKAVAKSQTRIRPSPSDSATEYPQGTIRTGNDGQKWVIKSGLNGIPRWVPYYSAVINSFRALTIDYLSKNIGKELIIFEREFKSEWPRQSDSNMYKLRWIPSGDAKYLKNKGILANWLKTQKPGIKDRSVFLLLGRGDWYKDKILTEMALQVDSKNKKIVSSNIMNMEAFVSD